MPANAHPWRRCDAAGERVLYPMPHAGRHSSKASLGDLARPSQELPGAESPSKLRVLDAHSDIH
eukprot:5657504-Amphidinium_carterae.1